jgi:hypothetical protein
MFYFVRRIANYLLTNKIPPRVIHPDLYPELRRDRPNPVPEQTGVNRPQIPRITNAHQPHISREMDLYSDPLPPPKGSIRHMLSLPRDTLMQQPPERKFVREEEPTSNTETQSSGDFHYVDSIIMKLPEPEPVSESGRRLSLPPHNFPELTTNSKNLISKIPILILQNQQ